MGNRNIGDPDGLLTRSSPRTARNSKPLEVIGTYDPIPKKDSYDESGKLHKDIRLDVDRAKYWIGVGAQPTDTVWRFLSMVRNWVLCVLRFSNSPERRTEMGILVRPGILLTESSTAWNISAEVPTPGEEPSSPDADRHHGYDQGVMDAFHPNPISLFTYFTRAFSRRFRGLLVCYMGYVLILRRCNGSLKKDSKTD